MNVFRKTLVSKGLAEILLTREARDVNKSKYKEKTRIMKLFMKRRIHLFYYKKNLDDFMN